ALCQSLESEGHRGRGSQGSWGSSRAKEIFLVFRLSRTTHRCPWGKGQWSGGKSGQQLLGIAAPGLGILQSCIHAARGPNEPQVQLLPWGRRLDF
ncbi:unnamed protein product, partial [Gulo gulo]